MQHRRRTRQPSEFNSQLTRRRPRQKKLRVVSSSTLLQLLRRGSWLFWVGILVFLLAIAAIAAFSLTHIGYVEQTGATPVTISTQRPNASAQTYSHIAVGLLGAIIFLTGFVTLGKQLYRVSRSYRIRQRVQRSAALELKHRREQRQQNSSSSESLAEMMDIRKRRSLNSILQKTN